MMGPLLVLLIISLSCCHGRKLIIDTDGSLNDMIALPWAIQSMQYKAVDILAITTVKSDLSPYDAFRNVIHILNLTIQSGPEEEAPFIRLGKSTEELEATGLDMEEETLLDDGLFGFSQVFLNYPEMLWPEDMVQKVHSAAPLSSDLLIELIQEFPNEITVVTMGPLTNLHAAESKAPGLLQLIDELYIFGGSFSNRRGDSIDSALSESNFNADPEAIAEIIKLVDGPNVYIFPLDTGDWVQFKLTDSSTLYGFLGQELQSEVEMCRVKIHGEDGENPMFDDYEDGMMNGEEEGFEYHCSASGLLYLFYEKSMEQLMRSNYIKGQCDCVQMRESLIFGHLLYPQLYDLKYVHCEVDEDTGMVWYDERLKAPTKDTMNLPNCFVNVKVDGVKMIQMFSRDLITLLETINVNFWKGMMDMDMEGFEQYEGMDEMDYEGMDYEGMEGMDFDGMDFDMEGGYEFDSDYVDGDYAHEYYDEKADL